MAYNDVEKTPSISEQMKLVVEKLLGRDGSKAGDMAMSRPLFQNVAPPTKLEPGLVYPSIDIAGFVMNAADADAAVSQRWPDWVLDIVDKLKADNTVNLASYSQCLAALDVPDRARIQMVVGKDRWFSVNVAATVRFMRRGADQS